LLGISIAGIICSTSYHSGTSLIKELAWHHKRSLLPARWISNNMVQVFGDACGALGRAARLAYGNIMKPSSGLMKAFEHGCPS
jgi:hypothetical protein